MKYYIFDWSGTLSDDFTPVYETSMLLMQEFGGQPIPREQFRVELEGPYMNFWKSYFPEVEKEEVDTRFAETLGTISPPSLYSGVVPVLKSLRKNGCKLIVFSSHPQSRVEAEARIYGIDFYFDALHGGMHNKQEAITEIMQMHQFDPASTTYVGDMRQDVRAAKEGKCRSIGITWGYHSADRLNEEYPDRIIHHMCELPR